MLPGDRDAAVQLHGLTGDDVARASEQYDFATWGEGKSGSLRPRRDGVRRRPAGRARHLQQHEHLGHPVLEGLEGADRSAELHPVLGVGHRHVDGARHQADLERARTGGPDRGRAGAGRRRRHRSKIVLAPGQVDAASRRVWSIDSQVRERWRGRPPPPHRRRPAARGLVGVEHGRGRDREAAPPRRAARRGSSRSLASSSVPARSASHGDERGQQRGRRERATSSSRTISVSKSEKPAPSNSSGMPRAATPICSHERLPQRCVVALGRRRRADGRGVGALGQQGAHGRGELGLLLGEREVHQSASSSRGCVPGGTPGCPRR